MGKLTRARSWSRVCLAGAHAGVLLDPCHALLDPRPLLVHAAVQTQTALAFDLSAQLHDDLLDNAALLPAADVRVVGEPRGSPRSGCGRSLKSRECRRRYLPRRHGWLAHGAAASRLRHLRLFTGGLASRFASLQRTNPLHAIQDPEPRAPRPLRSASHVPTRYCGRTHSPEDRR